MEDTISEDSRYTEVHRTCYLAKASSKEAGKLDLIKREASFAQGGFNIDETREQELIRGLDDFKIEYAYRDTEEEEIAWEEAWGDEETDEVSKIPKAVKIGISKGDIILTKYIWIPTGEIVDLEIE